MTDDPNAEYEDAYNAMLAAPYAEGSDRSRVAIDKVLAARSKLMAAEQQRGRYTTVGDIRVKLPEPEVEIPPAPPEPALELGPRFAPFVADLQRA